MNITDTLRKLSIGEKYVFNLKEHKRSIIDNTKSRLKFDEGIVFKSSLKINNNQRLLTVTRKS